MPALEGYDMVMLGILAVAAVIGFFKGFVWQLAWIVGIVVSGFVAIRFGSTVAPYFGQQPPWNRLVAMLVLYAASSVGVGFVFKLISGLIDKVHLSSFDHQLGLVFGAAKGLLMCIVVTFFAVTLAPDYRPQIVGSRSGRILADLIVRADAMLPPDIHELVEPFIRQFEEKLGSPSGLGGTGMDQLAAPADRSGSASPLAALWQGVTNTAAWSGAEGTSGSTAAVLEQEVGAALRPSGLPATPPNDGVAPAARFSGGFGQPVTAVNAGAGGSNGSSLFARVPSSQTAAGAGGAPPPVSPTAGFSPTGGVRAPAPYPQPPAPAPAAAGSGPVAPGPFPAGAQTPLSLR